MNSERCAAARARPGAAAAGRPGAASPWRPGTSSRRPWAAVAVWALAVGRLGRPARSQGARSKQQPKPSVACAGRQRCDFFAAPAQGSVGSTMWRSFSAAGGPVGVRGMARPRETKARLRAGVEFLNPRVFFAPFCAMWAREGRLARPATFPGDPGRSWFGALILAACSPHYSASVRGREDDTSSSASHFASRSSVGTLPG